MSCKSTSQLINEYGANWQNFVTVHGGPWPNQVDCDQYCCGVRLGLMSNYKLVINEENVNYNNGFYYANTSICCASFEEGAQCDGVDGSEHGFTFSLSFYCQNGVVLEGSFSISCYTAGSVLSNQIGTVDIAYQNDIPVGFTNPVVTFSSDQEGCTSTNSLCYGTEFINSVSLVPV